MLTSSHYPESISSGMSFASNSSHLTLEEVEALYPHIGIGGHWEPASCTQRQRVAIFVPLRDRWHQVPILVKHLHHFLVPQWRHYTVYIIEQAGIDVKKSFGTIFDELYISHFLRPMQIEGLSIEANCSTLAS